MFHIVIILKVLYRFNFRGFFITQSKFFFVEETDWLPNFISYSFLVESDIFE